jgi:hypothetical protein
MTRSGPAAEFGVSPVPNSEIRSSDSAGPLSIVFRPPAPTATNPAIAARTNVFNQRGIVIRHPSLHK